MNFVGLIFSILYFREHIFYHVGIKIKNKNFTIVFVGKTIDKNENKICKNPDIEDNDIKVIT
jgi:hypothetical protein